MASRLPTVGSSLVSQVKRLVQHGRNGELEKAVHLFEQIPLKNQVSWNAMLSVLVNAGRLASALNLFDEMPHKDPTSFVSMITGLSRSGLISEARQIFDSVTSSNHNVFSWTAMISCYAHNSEPLGALEFFSALYGDFFELNVLPDSHTFTVLLKSCGDIQSLPAAQQVHSLISKLLDDGSENCVFVGNSLIDVNAKLGNLVAAETIFNRMRWKDLESYNSMMSGYAHHLIMDRALEIFHSMEETDVLSWNIIMSGLSKSGGSEDALRLFLSLSRSEAKPNSSTYTIVLAASSTLTMLEFGRQIHGRILRNGFFQSNTLVCNALISMYASCGSNRDMEQVFDEMRSRDVISWNSVIQGLGQNGRGKRALEMAEVALVSKKYNHSTFTAILTSCSHAGFVAEGLEYFNSMRRKYGIEPSLDHYNSVVDMLGRAGKLEEAHCLLRETLLAGTLAAWGALLNACLVHGDAGIGRIAARELQLLDPGDARSYLALAKFNSDAQRTEEELLRRERNVRKEPGCSWLV